jgi:hypothetical protein
MPRRIITTGAPFGVMQSLRCAETVLQVDIEFRYRPEVPTTE